MSEKDKGTLKLLSTQRAELRQKHVKQIKEELVQEIHDLWQQRRFAELHRASLRLAGTRWGPKKRMYNESPAALPGASEWMDVWSLPGPQGGMEVVRVDWQEMIKEHKEEAGPLQVWERNDSEEAHMDLKGLKAYARRAGKRKAVPAGSMPLEVLHMILHPYRGISEKLFGVGFKRNIPPESAWCASNWLQKGLIHVRQSGLTPLVWHRTKGVALNKSNDPGPRGKRVVHIMDPIGKGFFAQLIWKKTQHHRATWTMGSYREGGRSRPCWCRCAGHGD